MDSARAEELVAGLGFKVAHESPSSPTMVKGGRRRKRPRGSTGVQDPDRAAAPATGGAANDDKVLMCRHRKRESGVNYCCCELPSTFCLQEPLVCLYSGVCKRAMASGGLLLSWWQRRILRRMVWAVAFSASVP